MTKLGADIERIMLNAIRFRDRELMQLEGEPGRKLAAEDRRWLLRYIDRLGESIPPYPDESHAWGKCLVCGSDVSDPEAGDACRPPDCWCWFSDGERIPVPRCPAHGRESASPGQSHGGYLAR